LPEFAQIAIGKEVAPGHWLSSHSPSSSEASRVLVKQQRSSASFWLSAGYFRSTPMSWHSQHPTACHRWAN